MRTWLILCVVSASFGLSAQEPQAAAPLDVFDGVKYLITVPKGCSSWMVTDEALSAVQFYSDREDCNESYFKTAVSRSAHEGLYGKTSTVETHAATDCCVYVNVLGISGASESGWIVRNVLDLPSDQRSIYEAKAKLKADAEKAKADMEAQEERRQDAKEAAEAEEKARVKAKCRALYKRTIDKKQAELTVRETQQIAACESLGLYK